MLYISYLLEVTMSEIDYKNHRFDDFIDNCADLKRMPKYRNIPTLNKIKRVNYNRAKRRNVDTIENPPFFNMVHKGDMYEFVADMAEMVLENVGKIDPQSFRRHLFKELDKAFYLFILDLYNGRATDVARALGVHDKAIYSKLRTHNIEDFYMISNKNLHKTNKKAS